GRAASRGAGGGVSRGPRAVRGVDAGHARHRAVAGPAVHGPRVRRHPRRDSRLLRLAAPRDAGVTSLRLDDVSAAGHFFPALAPCRAVEIPRMQQEVWPVWAPAAMAGVFPLGTLTAQGVTSAAVAGRVTDEAGAPVATALVTLTNASP